jgi:hypothetical protein
MEKFGESSVFQIKCIHDPMPNASGHVFGRMCLRFDGNVLGDLNEPACMLNVTAGHLEDVLCEIDALDEPELFALTDSELWERLDKALYRGDTRTNAEIAADSRKYSKFNFLTNGGESFDRSKSFIVASDSNVRILFMSDDANCSLVGKTINLYVFVEALQSFLKWIEAEGARMKAEMQ